MNRCDVCTGSGLIADRKWRRIRCPRCNGLGKICPSDWADKQAAELLPCQERGDCREETYHDLRCPAIHRRALSQTLQVLGNKIDYLRDALEAMPTEEESWEKYKRWADSLRKQALERAEYE